MEYLRFAVLMPLTFQVSTEYFNSVVVVLAISYFDWGGCYECEIGIAVPGATLSCHVWEKVSEGKWKGIKGKSLEFVSNNIKTCNNAGRSANGSPSKLGV